MTSVYIATWFRNGADHGGIKRVVDAQRQYLPVLGIDVLNEPSNADILVGHAVDYIQPQEGQHFVTHCHGLYWANYPWPKWANRANNEIADVFCKADAITAPSEWVANSIRRGTNLRCDVIGHGVNLDEWPVPKLGQIGNYVLWDKTRVDPVCDPKAVSVLAQGMPNVKFVTSLGDEAQNVQVIGVHKYEDHKQYVQNAMLYLATSRETFGIGTLEAMASGVPVVGWNWGGQSEFIVNRETGWLSPVGDYDDLKRGIEYCIEHRRELSYNARQLVESRFRWKDIIQQYVDLYELIAREPEPSVKVSVIVPSYNLAGYLPRAIDSVLAQTGVDFELIVVDDCSTDGSLDIAEGYDPARVRVIQTPHNLYLAGALNYGIRRAKGKYIIPLDPDNTLPLNTLKLLSDALDASRDIDIAYGKVRFINEDSSPYISSITDEQGVSRWPPPEFSYDQQLAHKNQIPSTSMYRKGVWERSGGYQQRYRTGEDADFWCRSTTYGARPAQVTKAVCLVYTVRQDSMSQTNVERPWEQWYTNVKTFVKPREDIKRVEIPEPYVSVVIPVGPGHGGQALKDALDSLNNQTFKDWECIVVDDTGGHIEWLPTWATLLSTQQEGLGVSVARNIGIAAARGQCFVLLDADDYLAPTYLERTYTAYQQSESKQVYVYTDFYKDLTVVKVQPHACSDMLRSLKHPVTCLYPVSLKSVVGFDETMRFGEDWDYVLATIAQGYCGVHVEEPLLYYRTASGSNRNGLLMNANEIRIRVQEKWGDKVAGCGCAHSVATPRTNGELEASQLAQDEMVLLEFAKGGVAAITYRGPITGTEYRFGSDEGHRLGYVYRGDVEWFIQRSEFNIATPS